MATTKIKWDETGIIAGHRVRTMYFQDHVAPSKIVEIDDSEMQLIDSIRGEDIVMAKALHTGNVWSAYRYFYRADGSHNVIPMHYSAAGVSKAKAIDVMLGRA